MKHPLIFLSLFLFGCSTESIDNFKKRTSDWAWVSELNGSNGTWVKVGDRTTIPDCKYTLFYDNGNIYQKGKYRNGEISDTTFYFDLEENLTKMEIHTDHGVLPVYSNEGPYTKFFPTGEIEFKGNVRNGKIDTKWTRYREDGTIKSEGTRYEIENDSTGWLVNYFETGIKRDSSYMLNGRLHGVTKFWYSDGQLKELVTWENGKQHGLFKTFYSNGQLNEETNWVHGQREGMSQAFHPNGNLRFICTNVNGIRQGEDKDYYPNGQLYKKCIKKDGVTEGPGSYYYQNGKMHSFGYYNHGKLDGEWKVYSSSGKLFLIEHYANDKLLSSEAVIELSDQEQKDIDQFLDYSRNLK